ncbi:IS5 family transposase [Rhodococcus opacus]|uniref:IS5 family transposase n=3 Tax=Rhodococcus opacus TaxID=37919 RepID=A0AAX3YW52_RHOOP|nr:IS5 family transposase [Rhodococcus opacus]MCZ4589333.1 IS5 family transposase [Rhodococcus opacus]WKN58732.1 IS5 family transposase [Rhodococcus opacus]WLF52508.1 IS5 family transposase [Rhodococcus opacus]
MADVVNRFEVLTDKQWELLALLLPSSDGLRGRKFQNSRLVVEGMLYRLRTGLPWRDLPAHFGPWKTVWKRHRRYAGDGTWDRVLIALAAMADAGGDLDWAVSVDSTVVRVHQHGANARVTQGDLPNYTNLLDEPVDHGIGRSRGGLTCKVHLACDGDGRPLSVLVGPGQAGDSPMLGPLLEGICVPRIGGGAPRTRPDEVRADKAYTSKANRELLRSKGIKAVIPEKSDQVANRKNKGSAGGRPPNFDAESYKGRNVVERAFNKAKQWRAVATRYDKLALTYRAGFLLAGIVEWLKLLGDMP